MTAQPPEPPEAYVTRRQLAERMGVHVSTVDRLVRAGMPSVVWGRKSRRFLPSEALPFAAGVQPRDARAKTGDR